MNHYYQRLIRTGASELTIADYQRQQLAVIYFVFLFHFFLFLFQVVLCRAIAWKFREGIGASFVIVRV